MENDVYSRYLSGDDRALLEIIEEYQGPLIMFINGIVCDMNAADELCSEVFIKLALKKPKFKGNSSFKTFLFKIGKNMALDYVKKRKKQAAPLDEAAEMPAGMSVEGVFLEKERKDALYRALERLKPEYSEALRLCYIEGLSNEEICGVMKKSLPAVKSLLHRARPALKKELLKEGFDYDGF